MSSQKRKHNSKPYNNISPQERYMQIINQAKQLVRDLLQEALNEEFEYFMEYPKYSRDNRGCFKNNEVGIENKTREMI